jgi:solute:Na+ symporter, SSS family
VFTGRLFGFIVVVGGVLLACSFSKMIYLIKFLWEFNILFAASFWLGMKWRRANRAGAWASIGGTMVLFMLIPMLVPLIPGVRTSEYLLKTVEPVRIESAYTAREVDVEQRNQEIARWEKQSTVNGIPETERPEPLVAGMPFSKITITPRKSIFWTQDLTVTKDGRIRGAGLLSPELVFLDKLGWDLSKNSYAFNETLRIIIRLLIPFLILAGVSLLTKRDESERAKRFFVRLRTPTATDPKEDMFQVEQSYNETDRFRETLLFPNSNWELFKWSKRDWIAMGLIMIGGALIFFLLSLVASIGRTG